MRKRASAAIAADLGAIVVRPMDPREALRTHFGFDDFRRNGLLLPANDAAAIRLGLPLHRGPHHSYNELVFERVGQIEAR